MNYKKKTNNIMKAISNLEKQKELETVNNQLKDIDCSDTDKEAARKTIETFTKQSNNLEK